MGVSKNILNPKHCKEQYITLNVSSRPFTDIAICRLKVAGKVKQRIGLCIDITRF